MLKIFLLSLYILRLYNPVKKHRKSLYYDYFFS